MKDSKILLLGVIFVVYSSFALLVFAPKHSFSVVENRPLSSLTKPSASEIIDGSFSEALKVFLEDHFPFKPFYISLKTKTETALGRLEVNGVYIGERLIKDIESLEFFDVNLKRLANFVSRYPNVNVALVPLASHYYGFSFMIDQGELLNSAKLTLGDNYIDIAGMLDSNRDSYIYYKTDHHWTWLGAYYGYVAICEALGIEPFGIYRERLELVNSKFYGSYHREALDIWRKGDLLELYHPEANILKVYFGDTMEEWDSLFFYERLGGGDDYSVFLDGNHAITTITTDSKGGELLVIKDSFAHNLVPYLTNHYSKITMVDLRYYGLPLDELTSSADDILILYSLDTLGTAKYLNRLR